MRRVLREAADALAEVKTLTGLLPICAGCKSIRNDAGYWERVGAYLSSRSEATFSHGLCPPCYERLDDDDSGG